MLNFVYDFRIFCLSVHKPSPLPSFSRIYLVHSTKHSCNELSACTESFRERWSRSTNKIPKLIKFDLRQRNKWLFLLWTKNRTRLCATTLLIWITMTTHLQTSFYDKMLVSLPLKMRWSSLQRPELNIKMDGQLGMARVPEHNAVNSCTALGSEKYSCEKQINSL